MLTWTTRRTPASAAASNSVSVLSNRPVVGAVTVGEPHPVGIEQNIGAPQDFYQSVGLVEVERMEGHTILERCRPVRVAGERLDLMTRIEETGGDVTARVATNPGNRCAHHP